jgi:hypothetical protein
VLWRLRLLRGGGGGWQLRRQRVRESENRTVDLGGCLTGLGRPHRSLRRRARHRCGLCHSDGYARTRAGTAGGPGTARGTGADVVIVVVVVVVVIVAVCVSSAVDAEAEAVVVAAVRGRQARRAPHRRR